MVFAAFLLEPEKKIRAGPQAWFALGQGAKIVYGSGQPVRCDRQEKLTNRSGFEIIDYCEGFTD